MAFINRDPRLAPPMEPSYPAGEIAVLQEEKRVLKRQADDLYIYKQHLKKELDKSKQVNENISKELEKVIAENTKNIDKLKDTEKYIDSYREQYHKLKRKMDEKLIECDVSDEKRYKYLNEQFDTLKNDYCNLKDKYDNLKKEYNSIINTSSINYKHKTPSKNYRARLCYHNKKCKTKECKFAHSIDEIQICPLGEECDRATCAFILHSEIGRMLFREYYRGKEEAICRDYDNYNACNNSGCNKIHYDFKTNKQY